jgi:protein-disulfide isomerase
VNLTRRESLMLAAAAAFAAATGLPSLAFAKDGDTVDQLKLMAPMAVPDKVLGDPNAKVTMIEYLSPTCPHCARMAIGVIGPFKDKYVTPGKVRLVYRPFARNTLDAGIFMLAEAAARSAQAAAMPAAAANTAASGEAMSSEAPAPAPAAADAGAADLAAATAWEAVIDTFFKTQGTWGVADKPLDAIKAVAFQLGFNDDTFNAALKDQALFQAIQTEVNQAVKDFGVDGTPTFYVNGKQVTGEKTLDELSAVVDPLL